MKALVGTFNQEKVLVGAFSVIVKTSPKVRYKLYLVFMGQAMRHTVCPRVCRCRTESDPTHLLLICIINFFSGLWYDSSSCKFGWDTHQQRVLATTGTELLVLDISYFTRAGRGPGAWHRSKWVNLDPRRAINVVEGPQSRTICLCLSSYFLQNIGISSAASQIHFNKLYDCLVLQWQCNPGVVRAESWIL